MATLRSSAREYATLRDLHEVERNLADRIDKVGERFDERVREVEKLAAKGPRIRRFEDRVRDAEKVATAVQAAQGEDEAIEEHLLVRHERLMARLAVAAAFALVIVDLVGHFA